jgi:hypothetical protein
MYSEENADRLVSKDSWEPAGTLDLVGDPRHPPQQRGHGQLR